MKKLVLVTVVAVAVLAWCAPAFAWPVRCRGGSRRRTSPASARSRPWTRRRTPSPCASTSPPGAADYLGDDLPIAVAADAHIFKAAGATFETIALSDLVVGEKLRVRGAIDYSSGSAVFVGKRLVMRRLPLNDIKRFAFRGPVTAVDATARALTATMVRVTRALSPYYHAACAFIVAPDVRLWVMKDGWPVRGLARRRRIRATGSTRRAAPTAARRRRPSPLSAGWSCGTPRRRPHALTKDCRVDGGPGGAMRRPARLTPRPSPARARRRSRPSPHRAPGPSAATRRGASAPRGPTSVLLLTTASAASLPVRASVSSSDVLLRQAASRHASSSPPVPPPR